MVIFVAMLGSAVAQSRGSRFEHQRHHCVVSLSKNINPSLVLVQPRKTHPFITERLLIGRKESNQTCGNAFFSIYNLPAEEEEVGGGKKNSQHSHYIFILVSSSSSSWQHHHHKGTGQEKHSLSWRSFL